MPEFSDVVRARRMTRAFSNRPVPAELIDEIVEPSRTRSAIAAAIAAAPATRGDHGNIPL